MSRLKKVCIVFMIIALTLVVVCSLNYLSLESLKIVADVVTIIANIATVAALVFVGLRIRESTRARHLEGLIRLFNRLNTPDARAERRAIYAAHVDGRRLKGKEIVFAEKIRADFDEIGIMMKEGLLPKRIALRKFSDTAMRCWESLEKHIEEQREKRGQSFLEDFEWLYEESKQYREKKYAGEEIQIFKQT